MKDVGDLHPGEFIATPAGQPPAEVAIIMTLNANYVWKTNCVEGTVRPKFSSRTWRFLFGKVMVV